MKPDVRRAAVARNRKGISEETLRKQCLTWLSTQHSKAAKMAFGMMDNIHMPNVRTQQIMKGQGRKRSLPDVYIDIPMRNYHGMRIELKLPHTSPMKWKPRAKEYKIEEDSKDGQHLREQAQRIQYYNRHGYFALFVDSLDKFKQAVDWYLDQREFPFEQHEFYLKCPYTGQKKELIWFYYL